MTSCPTTLLYKQYMILFIHCNDIQGPPFRQKKKKKNQLDAVQNRLARLHPGYFLGDATFAFMNIPSSAHVSNFREKWSFSTTAFLLLDFKFQRLC